MRFHRRRCWAGSRAYVAAIDRFAERNGEPGAAVRQGRVQRADRASVLPRRRTGGPLRGGADRRRAGEHDRLARLAAGWTGRHPHFEFARQQVFANHYYVRDPEWGRRSSRPAPAYVRWPAWVYLNGQRMALPSRLLRACSVSWRRPWKPPPLAPMHSSRRTATFRASLHGQRKHPSIVGRAVHPRAVNSGDERPCRRAAL